MSTAQKRAENEIKYIRNTMEYRRLRINKSNPPRLAELNKRIAKLQTIVKAVPVQTSKKPLKDFSTVGIAKPTMNAKVPQKVTPKVPQKVTPKVPQKVTPKARA